MPAIIIIQTSIAAPARFSGAMRLASRASSEVPAAPTPKPMMVNESSAASVPRSVFSRHVCRRRAGSDAADRECGHAAHYPWRAPRGCIRAVSPDGAQKLHGVVPSHQRAGEHGRQRQLDDHDAIERRRREHDDGAERGLHEAQP